jgi:DNA repair protein RadC
MANLQSISKFERPREKLAKYGAGKLTNAELLAILLRTGTKELNVLKLAQTILRKFEDRQIVDLTIADLKTIHGIGTVKASEIIACFELGKRMLKDKKTALLLTPQDVWEQMVDIRSSKKEHFVVFYLDTRNQEIKREIISVGTLNESLVHPREVFEGAIKHNAAAIIVAHNHPSGSIEPSQDDIEITKRLVHSGKLLDIRVLSHVIVTSQMYGIVEINN